MGKKSVRIFLERLLHCIYNMFLGFFDIFSVLGCYSWFYHTWWITLLWPSLSLCRLLKPHGPFLYLWCFQDHPLKTCNNCHTRLLIPFSHIYVGLTLKTVYIRMCAKRQILSEFSLMWIWLTCLLAFHIPWDHSDSTFHYPIEEQ